MPTIGERIHDRRVALGLSADDLAVRLGKNRATIYRYEGDEIENFPISVIGPLAQALGVSPAYLMGWEDTAPIQDPYSLKFRMRLDEELQTIDPDSFIGVEEAKADYNELLSMVQSDTALLLRDACEAADKIGRSMSYMLQEIDDDTDVQIRKNKKSPDSEQSEPRDDVERDIISRIQQMNPAQKSLLLAALQIGEAQENKTPAVSQE